MYYVEFAQIPLHILVLPDWQDDIIDDAEYI